MVRAFRVEKVAAGGVVTALVGEHTVEDENLFSVRVEVIWEFGARIESHERRDPARLDLSDQFQAFAPDSRCGTFLPFHVIRLDNDGLREVGIDLVGHDGIPAFVGHN